MKHNFQKYIQVIALILSIVLSGCASETVKAGHTSETVTDDNAPIQYSITQKNGKYYMNFSDGNEPSKGNSAQLAELEFTSLAEMQDTFLNNKLSIPQISIIKNFAKDPVNGILICDMKHLYQPVLPNDIVVNYVMMRGETYSFELITRNVDPTSIEVLNTPHGYFSKLTKDLYERDFGYEYEDLFERDTIHLTSTREDEDRNSTIYDYYTSVAHLRRIRYILTDGTKTLYIDEKYVLSRVNDGSPTSDTIPDSIYVYGCDNENYFSIDLFGFTERPSVEWLSSFGITEYISSNATVEK